MAKVLNELAVEGIATELIPLAGTELKGCTGCMGCVRNRDKKCTIKNDSFNETYSKLLEADGIVLGSPVYTADVTSQMKAFIDRAGIVSIANGGTLRRKVGAAVVVARRGGAISAFDTINHLFQEQQMFLVGSTYWNMAYGANVGEVEGDTEGMDNMINLGQNMAWLLKKIHSTDGRNGMKANLHEPFA